MASTTARLVSKTPLSPDTSDFRFAALDGRFAGFEPGAHVDVKLGSSLVRQYSIWDWDPDGQWFNVAVKREDEGRGGSLAMHALAEGAEIEIVGPRNHFPLQIGDGPVTLIAGGIGVTPIFAMARHLSAMGADFKVHYLVRSQEFAALDSRFRLLNLGERYHLHCDDRDGQFDLASAMRPLAAGGDVYICGPEPLLKAALQEGEALGAGSIRFERFAPAGDKEEGPQESFEVEIESTGAVYTVEADETILSVLMDHGIDVAFGCSEGLCGSCMVSLVSGEVDHRDSLLTPEEQETSDFLYVCVSRAKSKRLVLRL